MSIYYADTSALVKRYVVELGSSWMNELAGQHLLLTAQLSKVEIYSALNRRVREASLSPADYQAITADFEALCQVEYQLIAVTSKLINRTRTLLETHPLRVPQ
jgi:predicted nucleic acid-binding protein